MRASGFGIKVANNPKSLATDFTANRAVMTASAIESASMPLTGYVWVEGERIVGNVSLIVFHHQRHKLNMVANVAVHPDFRHRGIARALTERADEKAQMEKLVKSNPKLDYAWYGYSVLECLTGHYPEALQHLSEAIRLNTANRFQARNDSDFQNLAEDPRFTELLYPDPGADSLPSDAPELE